MPEKGLTKEDVEAAIYFVTDSLHTHEAWAEHLANGGFAPFVGDLEHHQRYIVKYQHVLEVLGCLSPHP